MTIKILGDVHGHHSQYLNLIQGIDYSVQLGDFGFNYECLKSLDSNKHKVLQGNHDNYDNKIPNFLGDFGTISLDNLEFYFVRGGFSLDKVFRLEDERRTGYKSYWEEEELSQKQGELALEDYTRTKPDIMLSHECPSSITNLICSPGILKYFDLPPWFESNTQILLQKMYEVHQPKVWIHCHYHTHSIRKVGETLFVCLDELDYIDIEKKDENVSFLYQGEEIFKMTNV